MYRDVRTYILDRSYLNEANFTLLIECRDLSRNKRNILVIRDCSRCFEHSCFEQPYVSPQNIRNVTREHRNDTRGKFEGENKLADGYVITDLCIEVTYEEEDHSRIEGGGGGGG